MFGTGSHRMAWACAALVSGPVYMAAEAAASFVAAVPKAIVIAPIEVVRFLVLLLPGAAGGFFVTVVPLFLTILILSYAAAGARPLRTPLVWTLTGGAVAALLALPALGEGGFSTGVASICTGMVSMRLARVYLSWSDLPPPAPPLVAPARTVRTAA